jgi:hypothetical protein
MQAKAKATRVVVPTTEKLVKKRLRELHEPITFFGEKVFAIWSGNNRWIF